MPSDLKPPRREKKSRRPIKRTSKESTAKANYSKLIRRMGEELDFDACVGCGRSDTVNDWSHRIPKSYRKDLECVRENLDRMCRERCHDIVEKGRWDELDNGEEIKEYIQRVDAGYFNWKYKKN